MKLPYIVDQNSPQNADSDDVHKIVRDGVNFLQKNVGANKAFLKELIKANDVGGAEAVLSKMVKSLGW